MLGVTLQHENITDIAMGLSGCIENDQRLGSTFVLRLVFDDDLLGRHANMVLCTWLDSFNCFTKRKHGAHLVLIKRIFPYTSIVLQQSCMLSCTDSVTLL